MDKHVWMFRKIAILSVCLITFGCVDPFEIFNSKTQLTNEYIIIDTGQIDKIIAHTPSTGLPQVPTMGVTSYGISEEYIYVIFYPKKDVLKLNNNEKVTINCKYTIIDHKDNTHKILSMNEWLEFYKDDIFNIIKPLTPLSRLNRICYDRTTNKGSGDGARTHAPNP